jgi:hypothetical protein
MPKNKIDMLQIATCNLSVNDLFAFEEKRKATYTYKTIVCDGNLCRMIIYLNSKGKVCSRKEPNQVFVPTEQWMQRF